MFVWRATLIALALSAFSFSSGRAAQLTAGNYFGVFVCAATSLQQSQCGYGNQTAVYSGSLGPAAWVGIVSQADCPDPSVQCNVELYAPVSGLATAYSAYWVIGYDYDPGSYAPQWQTTADFASSIATAVGSGVIYVPGSGGGSAGAASSFDLSTLDPASLTAYFTWGWYIVALGWVTGKGVGMVVKFLKHV